MRSAIAETTLPVRTFCSLPLPDDWEKAMESLQSACEHGFPHQIRWVRPDQCHLTLRFFGNVPANQIPSLIDVLADLCAQQSPFALNLGSLGAFPNLRAPRVIWLGLSRDLDSLRLFQSQVALGTQAWGEPLERRPFQPHLTLGRIKSISARQAEQIGIRLASLALPNTATWAVQEARLMRSELTPHGPVHTPLAEFIFKPTRTSA